MDGASLQLRFIVSPRELGAEEEDDVVDDDDDECECELYQQLHVSI